MRSSFCGSSVVPLPVFHPFLIIVENQLTPIQAADHSPVSIVKTRTCSTSTLSRSMTNSPASDTAVTLKPAGILTRATRFGETRFGNHDLLIIQQETAWSAMLNGPLTRVNGALVISGSDVHVVGDLGATILGTR